MNNKVLYQVGPFRIVEIPNCDVRLEDLKGDCFNPLANPSINAITLLKEELAFELEVKNEGVFGYTLEVWDPEVGMGWKEIDSCFGFIGPFHAENNRHYIFDEMKDLLTMKLQARENHKG